MLHERLVAFHATRHLMITLLSQLPKKVVLFADISAIILRNHKENTACAEPLAKAEADVALIQAESYTFLQDYKRLDIEPVFFLIFFTTNYLGIIFAYYLFYSKMEVRK
ncbi:hypothetical protein SRRS_41950 [Sporomusa rhizae]